jgi:putative addiction module component (TIGR02574 family)
MAIKIPLGEMTVAEKLQLMEELWEDLSREPDTIPSPDWHGDVLREREAEVRAGRGKFIDWEQAKAEIRRLIDEG